MKEDNKLTDAIIDLGVGMNELRDEMKGMRKDMNSQLGELNHRVGGLEKQQTKTNLAIGELRLSYIKLAEQQEITNTKLDATNSKLDFLRSDFNKYATANNTRVNGHEKRIIHLENSVTGGGKEVFLVKEPKAAYKRKIRIPALRKGKK